MKLEKFFKSIDPKEARKIQRKIIDNKKTNRILTLARNTPDTRYCDMHIHTEKSLDARFSIEKILNRLVENNILYASLTDHNNIDSYNEAVDIIDSNTDKYSKLNLYSGVEFNVKDKENVKRVHMLAYDFDPNNEKMRDLSDRVSKAEKSLYLKNLKYLEILFDIEFSDEEYDDALNNYSELGFDNLAKICMKHKKNGENTPIIKSFEEFDNLIKPLLKHYERATTTDNRLMLSEKVKGSVVTHEDIDYPTMDEFFEAVKDSKGVPVVAHPYTLKFMPTFNPNNKGADITDFGINPSKENLQKQNTERYLVHLKNKANDYGLDLGCEIVFKHKRFDLDFYNKICIKHSIIPSAGSDFHSYNKNIKNTIGTHESGIAFKNIPLLEYLEHRMISSLKFHEDPSNYYEDFEKININGKNIDLKRRLIIKNTFNKKIYSERDALIQKESTDKKIDNSVFIKRIKEINNSIKKRETVINSYDDLNNRIRSVNELIEKSKKDGINNLSGKETYILKKNLEKTTMKYLRSIKNLHDDMLENKDKFKEKYAPSAIKYKEESNSLSFKLTKILNKINENCNQYS